MDAQLMSGRLLMDPGFTKCFLRSGEAGDQAFRQRACSVLEILLYVFSCLYTLLCKSDHCMLQYHAKPTESVRTKYCMLYHAKEGTVYYDEFVGSVMVCVGSNTCISPPTLSLLV
jgi:hypothetical protein